jgi:hypothetical protein
VRPSTAGQPPNSGAVRAPPNSGADGPVGGVLARVVEAVLGPATAARVNCVSRAAAGSNSGDAARVALPAPANSLTVRRGTCFLEALRAAVADGGAVTGAAAATLASRAGCWLTFTG